MNIPIIIFVSILLFFVIRGYQKGFIVSITRYLSCLLAYLVSILSTNRLSNIIAQHSHLEGLVVYFVAAGLIFFVISIIANYMFGKLFALFFANDFDDGVLSSLSKFGGALLGSLAGCFIGLLLVYVVNFSQKMAVVSSSSQNAIDEPKQNELQEISISSQVGNESQVKIYHPQEDVEDNKALIDKESALKEDSFIELASKKVVNKTLNAVANLTTKNSSAKTITNVLSNNPEAAFDNLRNFVKDENVIRTLADPQIKSLLNKGNAEELLKNESFHSLINNKNIKAIFAGQKEKVIADSMIQVWRKVDSVKNNPRVIEIMSDKEFIEQINSANTLQLLINPKLKELVDIVSGKND